MLLASLAIFAVGVTIAQFPEGGGLYKQEVGVLEASLDTKLQNHPDLEDLYFPKKYLIPTDFYRLEPTTTYSQNVIFDPCRGHKFDCCKDVYGTPEFRSFNDDGSITLRKDNGALLDPSTSRQASDELEIDENCKRQNDPDVRCASVRMRYVNSAQTAACWNYNASIVAGVPCRAPLDGTEINYCMEVGFTQTAWIVECGGTYANDPHCGTFLEIHRPGDNTTLSATKLRGQLTSGYRTTIMSTTFKGNSSLLLCEGKHEIWWVIRTKYDWVIQRKFPFYIVGPPCDWDVLNNRSQIYAANSTRFDLKINPFQQTNFLFDQSYYTGSPGYPAKGMGGTLVLPSATDPSVPSEGELPGINVEDYQPPSRPSKAQFAVQHPDIPLDADGLPIVTD